MNIFTKRPDRPKWCSAKPRHRFAYQWLDNVKINKYAKPEPDKPWGSKVMTTTQRTDAQQTLVHPKRLLHMPWLENVDMHLYAKCDEKMPLIQEL